MNVNRRDRRKNSCKREGSLNLPGKLLCFCTFALLLCGTASGAFNLPDTGLTTCYDADGNVINPCPAPGWPLAQDGSYPRNPLSYADNGDGTITDNNTGLMWQKCTDGRYNATCSDGYSMLYNWYQAAGEVNSYNPSDGSYKNVCGSLNLGGYSDWRLPSKKELITIVDYSKTLPDSTINADYFPNTDKARYWTSTTAAIDPLIAAPSAWTVFFYNGAVFFTYKAERFFNTVRCVRGEQYQQPNFVDNNDGTVTDLRTGLMWQQENALGEWAYALSYCEGLNLANQTDWRLPNIKELASITDETIYDPIDPVAIDRNFFPNASVVVGYLSSTTSPLNGNLVLDVDFGYGFVGLCGKSNTRFVRCVRVGGEVPSNGADHFTWPVDPQNTSNGHYDRCRQWIPNDCYWLSDVSEDRSAVWIDVQPFQRDYWQGHGFHLGADYTLGHEPSGKGMPVYPVAKGIIPPGGVKTDQCGFGNIIFVQHDTSFGTYTSMYARVDWLDSGPPQDGDSVSPDYPIAAVGNGYWMNHRSCRNQEVGGWPYHLHFELREGTDIDKGPAYTRYKVDKGPQGQIDPNAFISTHR